MRLWKSRIVTAMVFLLFPCAASAREPAREFLEALRNRGYHQLALDYLDREPTNRLWSEDFRSTILYEKAITLADAARFERDPARQLQRLTQAKDNLSRFVQENGDHEFAEQSRRHLGSILLSLAGANATKAEESNDDKRKTKYVELARKLYDDARQVFLQRKESLGRRLQELPATIDPDEQPTLHENRRKLRIEYVFVQFKAAEVGYRKAETYRDDSEKYHAILEEAAREFQSISEKYRGFQDAKLFRGRCYQDMGDCKRAVVFFQEILDIDDSSPAVAMLKTRALRHAMECWLDPSIHQLDLAIERGHRWIARARRRDPSNLHGLAVRWLFARASIKKSKQPDTKVVEQKRLIADARKQAQIVANHPGPSSRAAKEFLATLDVDARSDDATAAAPENFVEAAALARDAWDQVANAEMLIDLVNRRINETTDRQRQAEMREQIAQAKTRAEENRQRAVERFERALRLADSGTSLDELNQVRYWLCYLYYSRNDYFRAATLGTFVARRYPSSANAKDSARIALTSFVKLYYAPDNVDQSFESKQIVSLADHIATSWPGTREADEALATLVTFMLSSGKLDDARSYLARISPDSNRLPLAKISVGNALWNEYVKRRDEAESTDGQPARALTELRGEARTVLESGVSEISDSTINVTALHGFLTLARIYLDIGQPGDAYALISRDRVGPLKLVEKGDSRISQPGLAEEVYRVALRASIALLAHSDDKTAAVANTRQLMESLKAEVGTDSNGERRLIAVYVSLARDLGQQMKAAAAAERPALFEGYEAFLQEIAAGTTDLSTLNWVGTSFLQMGELIQDDGDTALARRHYAEAAEVFARIIQAASDGSLSLTPTMLTQIRIKIAAASRRADEFDDALKHFADVLRETNNLVSVQIEAAKTLQQSGRYGDAIRGVMPNSRTKKNTIWGWGEIARILGQQMYRGKEARERFSDSYFEANYNLAVCHFRRATELSGEEKTERFRRAKVAVVRLHTLYPDFGGQPWRGRFDNVMRKVQEALGEPVKGIEALDS